MQSQRAEDRWWEGAVIYEIYPRSFQDSNGDGVGDLPGIISRLDYLRGQRASLGVDAIWLTPIYPSPLYDFGYDISDYTGIDPIYGSLADFDRLVEEAHRRGIRIIMDLVANHSSHLHPWFQESRSSRQNPRRSWYVWRDPKPGGGPPNNWLSVFGGPAWTLDEKTGQYYLHSFLAEQPDLNWHNPEVREAMFDVVRFWVARGVDGFRLDAVNHIAKDAGLPDNPPAPPGTPPGPVGYHTQLHLHDMGTAELFPWLAGLRAAADESGRPIFLVSEIYELEPQAVGLLHGADETPRMHMTFNFGFLQTEWSAKAFRDSVEEFEGHLPANAWPNVVLNNHDQPRFVSRYGGDGLGEQRARLAAMLMLTLRATVFLYYGEEIGMRDGTVPLDRLRDPVGIRFPDSGEGRDPERTPMQWNGQPGAGFTTGGPWLPIAADYPAVNVEAEQADATSLLSLYRDLISLRHACGALEYGAYRPVDGAPEDVYAYAREAEEETVLVVLNFATRPRTIDLSTSGTCAEILLRTDGSRGGPVDLSAINLAGNAGVVLRLER